MSPFCRVCSSAREIRHLPLYVFGSEGLDICLKCEMQLVVLCRKLAQENTLPIKTKEVAIDYYRDTSPMEFISDLYDIMWDGDILTPERLTIDIVGMLKQYLAFHIELPKEKTK